MTNSVWQTRSISLAPRMRGFHLITDSILRELPEIEQIETGLLHLHLQHTSASLTLNENADPSVRRDLEQFFNHTVAENTPYFTHTYEGPDDMPAHVKSSLLGCQVTLPVASGRLQLGTWQGILLGEHRDDGGSRKIIATLQGISRG